MKGPNPNLDFFDFPIFLNKWGVTNVVIMDGNI